MQNDLLGVRENTILWCYTVVLACWWTLLLDLVRDDYKHGLSMNFTKISQPQYGYLVRMGDLFLMAGRNLLYGSAHLVCFDTLPVFPRATQGLVCNCLGHDFEQILIWFWVRKQIKRHLVQNPVQSLGRRRTWTTRCRCQTPIASKESQAGAELSHCEEMRKLCFQLFLFTSLRQFPPELIKCALLLNKLHKTCVCHPLKNNGDNGFWRQRIWGFCDVGALLWSL